MIPRARRRWRWSGLVLLVIVLGGLAFFFVPHRLEDVSAARANLPSGDELVTRGAYLAAAADCAGCHTLQGGPAYAGGLGFTLPMGTIYAPNITPDKETGIGDWSDAEFVRALHHGVGRNGEDLYPAFPYTAYALMSTEDVLAIKAYLFSLAPVRAPRPTNLLSFPYNQRWAMRAWKLLYLPGHRYQADAQRSAEWNRGAYLVEALGHCGECHTPRTALFGLDEDRKFAGAVTGGWKAYNITNDSQAGVGGWSDDQLLSYFAHGHAEGRGPASGSMAEVVEYSLQHLTPDDLRAMIAYLRTVPPKAGEAEGVVEPNPPALQASTALTPPPQEAGQGAAAESLGLHVFQSACASCHGWDGSGLQHPHAALRGSQTVNDPAATNLLQVILHGSHLRTGEGDVFMPAFGSAYSDTEIAAVANYVLAHFGAKQGSVTPAEVAQLRQGREQ